MKFLQPLTMLSMKPLANVAENKQHELITKAITIAQKVCALNSNAQLSPAAQYCMSLYHCFLDIISPFVYPFKFSRNQLDRMHSEMPAKMKKFCSMLLTNNLGLHFETHPQSWYMHLLAFHALDMQLEFLRKFQRPLASFAMQQCEFSNKVKKDAMVSLYSFTNRPVGNAKVLGPIWKNKNGYLIGRRRVSQLYYSFLLGRQRNPYQCSNCSEYGHNAGSKECPVKIILEGMEGDPDVEICLQDIDAILG